MSSATITRNDLAAILNEIFPSVAMIDFFYPVGSYYETSDITFNPNVAWGGTWSLETAGQVHVSAGTGYSVAGALTNESDGGATTSATGNHKLVENELPKISGRLNLRNYGSSGGATAYNPTGHFSMAEASSTSASLAASGSTGSRYVTYEFGGNGTHNHGSVSTMQPYIVVNRWHRTA